MDNEIVLKSGWIKIDKDELDRLRKKMREQYVNEGGSKKFNSHLPNYNELRDHIRARIDELKSLENLDIKIEGQYVYDLVPGKTFFKDLFYTKKDAESPQFQEYNIEICYLYTYGKTRFAHKIEEKATAGKKRDAKIHEPSDRKIIVSSTINNMIEAEKIKERLSEHFGFIAESETRDTQAYSKGSLEELYSNPDKDSIVVTLISRDYLQNENCIKELIHFTKNNMDKYLAHTFHILYKDIYQGDFNIFDSLGRSELLKYWKLRIEKLEENHKLLMSDKREQTFFSKLREELDEIKEIIDELHNVLDLIRENRCSVLYDIFFNKIEARDELLNLFPKPDRISPLNLELEKTYKSIKIPSNNDPNKPEFPPEPFYTPKFPASQTFKIDVPGFSDVCMKDESTNPTGTHKDRMAWEVVIKYKSMIDALKYKSEDSLPQMSLISSGSAAIAIQHLFNLFKIPTRLKVLCDSQLHPGIKKSIKEIGCELYEYDLSEKLLNSEDIKELTDNMSGIDITYRESLDANLDTYYDWMSYEILNEKPDYCFIPFGTGDLFINILNIVKTEYFYSYVSKHDPRFYSDIETLKKCHYFGASSNVPQTKLDKLYSKFLPSIQDFHDYIDELKSEYKCVGNLTDIYYVHEKYVDKAIEIAEAQQIKFEPSGLAGLALLLQMTEDIPKNKRILIVNTGKTKELDDLIK